MTLNSNTSAIISIGSKNSLRCNETTLPGAWKPYASDLWLDGIENSIPDPSMNA